MKWTKAKLLNACINGNGDVFKEVKSLRISKTTVASSIDGETSDIAGHFVKICNNLYNSVEDNEEIERIKRNVNGAVNKSSLDDVQRLSRIQQII